MCRLIYGPGRPGRMRHAAVETDSSRETHISDWTPAAGRRWRPCIRRSPRWPARCMALMRPSLKERGGPASLALRSCQPVSCSFICRQRISPESCRSKDADSTGFCSWVLLAKVVPATAGNDGALPFFLLLLRCLFLKRFAGQCTWAGNLHQKNAPAGA